jgi:protein-disulfide isomerase
MFLPMKLSYIALAIVACRNTDGHANNNVPAHVDSVAAASLDSARTDSLLTSADLGRIQGDTSALFFLEVSDFQCPFCKRWHDNVYPFIKREYVQTGRIRMAYVNLPLQQHAHAQQAAEAAMCASAQNRFWPMHDALFDTQDRWAPLGVPEVVAYFDSLARSVGVNVEEWRQCARGSTIARIVNGDRSRAVAAGVRSTPTFIVGGLRIEGAQPVEVFRKAIEEASRTTPPNRR